MNHVYRRIWSTARQCWVVASELSQARGKRSQTVRASAAAAVLLMAAPMGAMAAEPDDDELKWWEQQTISAFGAPSARGLGATPSDEIAVAKRTYYTYNLASHVHGNTSLLFGSNSSTNEAYNLVLGNYVHVAGEHSIGIGFDADVINDHAIGIGNKAYSSGIGATALGYSASANGTNAVAIGKNSTTGRHPSVAVEAVAIGGDSWAAVEGAVALGGRAAATGKQALAIGQNAQSKAYSSFAIGANSKAVAEGAIAFGYSAKVEDASATFAVAIGEKATAAHTMSVALGADSVTDGNHQVSVGSRSLKRKIVNVKDGSIYAGSSEAVTGGQLHTTNQKVDEALEQVRKNDLIASGTSVTNGNKAVASGSGALAVGVNSKATTNESIALGYGTQATGSAAIATGVGAIASGRQSIAVGDNAKAAGYSGYAIGTRASAAAEGAVALGHEAQVEPAAARSAIAIGEKAKANHAGAIALGANSVTAATNTVSVGSAALKRRIQHVADGAVAADSSDAVTGGQLHATNNKVNTAQADASAAKTQAGTALAKANALGGLIGQTASNGNVRVGAENTGTVLDVRNKGNANRKVTGVADGSVNGSSTDAVTGRQLHATNTNVTTAQNAANAAKTQAGEAYTLAGTANTNATDALTKATAAANTTATGTVATSTNKAIASGTGALAIGTMSRAQGDGAITIGADAKTANVSSHGSIAIGDKAYAGGYQDTIALGRGARASGDGKNMALGAGSVANHEGSVALGAGSITAGGNSVSVGSSTLKRRIQHVADGNVAADSSDAVTGRQLHATNNKVTTAQEAADAAKTQAGEAYNLANTANTNAGTALDKATELGGLIGQTASNGSVRVGAENTGTVLDVRNKGNANRKVTGVADGGVNASSTDAVTGRQLHATNTQVTTAQDAADAAKIQAGTALAKATELGGLIGQTASDGSVRVGAENTGTVLDLRNGRNQDRVVVGAADGLVAAGSNQLVTGSQLHAASKRVERLEGIGRFFNLDIAESSVAASAEGHESMAIGDEARADKNYSMAVGMYAVADAEAGVAIGHTAHVGKGAVDGFALGTQATVQAVDGVAIGAGATVQVDAKGSVALGHDSSVQARNEVSVGNEVTKRTISNVASGTLDHHASTVGQLSGVVDALGGGAKIKDGNVIAPSYAVADGTHATVGDALSALDERGASTASRVETVEGTLQRVFREEQPAVPGGPSQLLLGGTGGVPMVLGNVAAGRIGADSLEAINGGQLHAVKTELNDRIDGLAQHVNRGRGTALATGEDAAAPAADASAEDQWVAKASEATSDDTDATASTAAAKAKPASTPEAKGTPETPVAQVDTTALDEAMQRVNERTDQALAGMERRLDKMDKRFNRMAAMSSAQAAMAMNTAGLKTYNRLGAGVGHSEGESALSVGYQRVLNEQGSATFSLNGAFTNSGERSIGVGMGIGW